MSQTPGAPQRDQSAARRAYSLHTSRRSGLYALLAIAAAMLLLCLLAVAPGWRRPKLSLGSHTVARGDVLVRHLHRGTLESAKTTEIVCEVQAHGRDGHRSAGAQILWIAPDGAAVNKGDLLVQLDSALLRELRDEWRLKVVESETLYKQAELRYENQQTKRDTDLANAQAKLKEAETAKSAFEGTRDMDLSDQSLEVATLRENVEQQKRNVRIAETLHRAGTSHQGIGTPEDERLKYLADIEKLAQAATTERKMRDHEQPRKHLELKTAVEQAQRALAQSCRNHQAELDQLLARKNASEKILDTQRKRLQHYEEQLEKCKIYAPCNGLVVYASNSRDGAIGAGAVLRDRQTILTLHDASQLQVKVPLTPELAQRVQVGVTASIESIQSSGVKCQGVVKAVGQVGSSSEAILATNAAVSLPPGASVLVEILLERRQGVVRIPLQSITYQEGTPVCYVTSDRGLEQRVLTLGATDDQHAEVILGLRPGESVVLDPEAAKSALSPAGN